MILNANGRSRRTRSCAALGAATTFLLTMLAPMIGATSATAAGESVSSPTGVIYVGCWQKPYSYSADPSLVATYTYWYADLTLYDQGGQARGWDGVSYLDGTSGIASMQVCGTFASPGQWRLHMDVHYFSTSTGTHSLDTYLTMRDPLTKTALSVNDTTAAYGQQITFTAKSRLESSSGYLACRYCAVALQKFTSTGWKTVSKRIADSSGIARFVGLWPYVSNAPLHYRAVTQRSDDFQKSISGTAKVS